MNIVKSQNVIENREKPFPHCPHLVRFKTVTLLTVHIKYDQRGAGRHGTHLPHLKDSCGLNIKIAGIS